MEVSFGDSPEVVFLSIPLNSWQTRLTPVPHDPETVAVSPCVEVSNDQMKISGRLT